MVFVILSGRRKNLNDTAALRDLIPSARFARCRSRFVMPVILYRNKVCRQIGVVRPTKGHSFEIHRIQPWRGGVWQVKLGIAKFESKGKNLGFIYKRTTIQNKVEKCLYFSKCICLVHESECDKFRCPHWCFSISHLYLLLSTTSMINSNEHV